MPKYLGPADVLVVDDREYRKGQNVPLSKERVEHMTAWGGHRFETDTEPEPVLVSTPEHPIALGDDSRPLHPAKAAKEAEKAGAPATTGPKPA